MKTEKWVIEDYWPVIEENWEMTFEVAQEKGTINFTRIVTWTAPEKKVVVKKFEEIRDGKRHGGEWKTCGYAVFEMLNGKADWCWYEGNNRKFAALKALAVEQRYTEEV